METQLLVICRSPFKAFIAFGLLGTALGGLGGLIAPELILPLVCGQGILLGLCGASIAGLVRWRERRRVSWANASWRRKLVAIGVGGMPVGLLLSLALFSDKPLATFLLFGGLLYLCLITALGIVSLGAELALAVGKTRRH